MSFFSRADDEVPEVVDFSSVSEDKVESVDYATIQELGVSAQRLAISKLRSRHMKGTVETAYVEPGQKVTPEKVFHLTKLIEWSEGDPTVVVDALRQRRTRARLSAAMGRGKSTRLASHIAQALSYKVLHVGLEVDALQQVGVYMSEAGIGKFRSSWSKTPGSYVCCMTYADFNGYMMSPSRKFLFECFNLIIFDEAFVNNRDVNVAKSNFAVHASADISLLCCSATIRTDSNGDEGGSGALGNFKQMANDMTLHDAMSSGKLLSTYLVDRSMVVLPTNEQAYELADYYVEGGIECKVLDDAGSYDDLRRVNLWLLGDASTPRVLIVVPRWAIGYNFFISYVILFPYESRVAVVNSQICEEIIPMSEELVLQAKSRTGRGMTDASGGVVMSPVRSERDVAIIEQDVVAAFVDLCACSIAPSHSGKYARAFEVFPHGLTPAMAQSLVKTILPAEVFVRYLSADGTVPRKYVTALNVFAHPDHYLQAGDCDLPRGIDKWFDQEVYGTNVQIKVPFKADGEMGVILQSIELIASGHINVPRWRAERTFAYGDGYDSDGDELGPRIKKKVINLRRVENTPYELPSVHRQELPWTYVAMNEPRQRRDAVMIDQSRFLESLALLDKAIQDYTVPDQKMEVLETTEGSVVPVFERSVPEGQVESPGGSVICTLPASICEKMNEGKQLKAVELEKVVSVARLEPTRFVCSKLFDSLAGAWDSYLDSILDDDVASLIIKRGLATDAYAIVDLLRGRFNTELISILANSNIYKKRFLKVFTKLPSISDAMKAISKGKFDGVAQTDGYIARVRILKEKIDSVLLHADQKGIYLANYITKAQRSVPIRGTNVLGSVGEDVFHMPRPMGKILNDGASIRKKGGRYLIDGTE